MCVCVCVCAVTQLRVTHCDTLDCSPPGSSVHRIFQEQVAIFYSGHLPDPGIECMSLASPSLVGGFFSYCTTQGLLVISISLHLESVSTIYSYILNEILIEISFICKVHSYAMQWF